jgi:transcriptional regulator with GAF, ATPase, and Fis domain
LLRLSDRLREQNVYLQEEIDAQHAFPDMIGRSDSIARVRKDIARVAGIESTVLIFGETGVGKELVARAIHAGGPHADQPMVKINCAAIPEGMVESELFGHERGAFTTAVAKRIGRFELARDATLFLDEIGELPLSIQAKLLRVLQDGEFERVGGSQTLVSNARIVAATNRDLEAAVAAKTFRSDLYYRLKVFPITVPPLRDRPEDISLLVNAFVAIFNRQMGKRVSTIDTAWLDDLRRRDWPGNIRELKHVIERAMISGDGPILRGEMVGATTSAPSTNAAPISVRPNVTLNELEAQHIRRVLDHTRGKIEGAHGAAVLLGLRPSTLRSRMKRLSIHRDQI